jgi:AcrR family transcriptional regulator
MQATASGRSRRAKQPQRTQDPDGTRQDIVAVATREFAEHGLAGARIDEIAAKTRSSKRMIYYYFGDKDGLYLKVLEAAYAEVRAVEGAVELDDLPPAQALRRLVEVTFDHHNTHEDFIRLVMIENIHRGDFLARSRAIQELNVAAIGKVERLYRRGVKAGAFRPGLDPIDLHWQISALCFFNVSNRATFSSIFKRDLAAAASLASLREGVVDMILRHVEKR